MHIAKSRDFQEWIWTVGLTSGQNVLVPIGSESGTQTVGNVVSMPFLRFGFYAHKSCDIFFEVSNDNINWHVPVTLNCLATTWYDCYNLVAPRNATGYWMIPWALLKIRLVDTSASTHTYTRFEAIAYTN